jgi:hypothetical protein
MRLKPYNIGTCWKGLWISFHVIPLFSKSFHFWVSFITFCNFLKIPSILKGLNYMYFLLQANNWFIHSAIKHFWEHHNSPDDNGHIVLPHVITSNLEHDSVKLVLETYKQEGKIGKS